MLSDADQSRNSEGDPGPSGSRFVVTPGDAQTGETGESFPDGCVSPADVYSVSAAAAAGRRFIMLV